MLNISRLGFGLSSIAGSGNYSHQENLVRTAIEYGITHFDVAPYYGSGDAEKILGDILTTCREKVTITTKYGLIPFGGSKGANFLRASLRPVLRKVQPLKNVLSSLINHTHPEKKINFEKGALTSSLDQSIKKLRRPVDIFLLHDVELPLAQNRDLIEELSLSKKCGKTLMTGISGSAENVQEMVNRPNNVYEVAQLENSLLTEAPINRLTASGAMVITHRAIQGGLNELTFLIEKRPTFRRIWVREFAIEPNKTNLVKILIELALIENPNGTVLFSTTRSERIINIAEAVTSPVLGHTGCRLFRNIFRQVKVNEL